MVSDLQSLIVAIISGNEVPCVPPRNMIKDAIGSAVAMNSAKINDAETITAGAAAAAKLIDRTHDSYVPQ